MDSSTTIFHLRINTDIMQVSVDVGEETDLQTKVKRTGCVQF